MIFSFEQSQHERLEIDVLRYERAPVGDYHDDNWLNGQILVHAGGFRGKVDFAILTDELVEFHTKLKTLYESLRGEVAFAPMEEQLLLRLVGDGKGHIELTGEVVDQPGVGNGLHFTLQIDQTQLAVSIHALEKIISQYPVRRS